MDTLYISGAAFGNVGVSAREKEPLTRAIGAGVVAFDDVSRGWIGDTSLEIVSGSRF